MAFVTCLVLGIVSVIFGFLLGIGTWMEAYDNKAKESTGQRNLIIGLLGALLFFGSASNIDDIEDQYAAYKAAYSEQVTKADEAQAELKAFMKTTESILNEKEREIERYKLTLETQKQVHKNDTAKLKAQFEADLNKVEVIWEQRVEDIRKDAERQYRESYEAYTEVQERAEAAEKALAEFKEILGE